MITQTDSTGKATSQFHGVKQRQTANKKHVVSLTTSAMVSPSKALTSIYLFKLDESSFRRGRQHK